MLKNKMKSLKNSKEIIQINNIKTSLKNNLFSIKYLWKNEFKIVIFTPKKIIKKSYQRNKIRRRIKEIVRKDYKSIHLIIAVKENIFLTNFLLIKEKLEELLNKI